MCDSCSLQANYFHSVDCIYGHLLETHPVLWLRDSSLIRKGYVSRNLLNPAGEVQAIWNGEKKGWRLRKFKHEALDELPDPTRGDFTDLSVESDRFQAFLLII